MTTPTTRTLGKDDWMTPGAVFDPVHKLCRFDLDACATNHEVARLDQFISPETDALKARWSAHGRRVWCNPPYGKDIHLWVEKAAKAVTEGCDLVALLMYANTETKYWRKWVVDNPHALFVVFIKPRIRFVRPDGEKATGAPKGSALVFFTPAERPPGHLPHLYWDYNHESFNAVADTLNKSTPGATP